MVNYNNLYDEFYSGVYIYIAKA